MDDITSGGNKQEVVRFKGKEDPETLACDGTMTQILGEGHLRLKAVAVSGDPDEGALEKLSGTVLCLVNSTSRDTLVVRFKVNVSARRRGAPTGPDITRDTLGKLKGVALTRKLLLGVTNSQFDQ